MTLPDTAAAPAHKLLECGDGATAGGLELSPPRSAAMAAAAPLEKPFFVGRVIRIYLHTLWGLCKQVILALLAALTTALVFRIFPDPGMALLITVCVVLPIYIIAAFESAGSTTEEAAGFAIFSSVHNFLKPTPPNPWARTHAVKL